MMILSQSLLRIKSSVARQCFERHGRFWFDDFSHRWLTLPRPKGDCSHNSMTLRREVVDKILIDIPVVFSLTVQGAMALGMFLLATLFDGVDITILFAIYILFWSFHYTTAVRSHLNERRHARLET